MNMLKKIIANKHKEVAYRKEWRPVPELERRAFFSRTRYSMKASLTREHASGIIAEFKRKSPSQGMINSDASIEQISAGYAKAGASGISVLTDAESFGGRDEDVLAARRLNNIPILRKDFVVDEYQIIETKAIGADVVLLIAAALSPELIRNFASIAHGVGLEVLLEVHDEIELMQNLESGADMIGVNNRNLKTFGVSVETSKQLADKIPETFVKISESGIESVQTVVELRMLGYDGFLMGQNFMKQESPELACKAFIDELRMMNYK